MRCQRYAPGSRASISRCARRLATGLRAVARRVDVPLVSRMPRDPAGLMERLGIEPGDRVVTWAMGRTPPAAQPLDLLELLARECRSHGLRLALAERVARAVGMRDAIELPEDLYWPDLLTRSALVVSKAGYSTLAETLRGAGRLLVLAGHGTAEEAAMARAVEREGHGLAVDIRAADAADRFLGSLRGLLVAPARAPILDRGEIAIAVAVERM